jgi:ATP-dependent RNA helicase RhlE
MLVLSPTRELAAQIATVFPKITPSTSRYRLRIETVFGGVPIGKQIRAMAAGVDILVATPGRLLDLIDQRALTLAATEIFVLDEADQMMDLGFIHALKRVRSVAAKEAPVAVLLGHDAQGDCRAGQPLPHPILCASRLPRRRPRRNALNNS